MGSRRTLVAAAAWGLLLLVPGSAAATSSTTLTESFESGGTTKGQWIVSNAAMVRTGAHDDRYEARLTSTGSGSYLYWPAGIVPPGRRYWSARVWVRVPSHGAGQSVSLLSVKDRAGVDNADFFTEASTGRCRVDLLRTDSTWSSSVCDDGAWHLIEMRGDYGSTTYTLDWRVDGIAQSSVASTGRVVSTVDGLWLGDATPGKTNVVDVDDVALSVADTPLPFLGRLDELPVVTRSPSAVPHSA